jgi:ADP-ribosylglycohydrolase
MKVMKAKLLRRLLAGLAAGDSLGSTSEFVLQRDVPSLYQKESDRGWPFKQVGGGHAALSPGDPTDDTLMALCMVKSFLKEGKFDPCDIALEFVSWMKSGPIDIGTTTFRSLKAIEDGSLYWQGGLEFWKELPNFASNGSLMRNGIVPGMADTLTESFSNTIKHGMITHYAPLPQICCLAHTYLIWNLLHGRGFEEKWMESFESELDEYFLAVDDSDVQKWHAIVSEKGDYRMSLATFRGDDWDMERFDPFRIDYNRGTGYCLMTLRIAIWGLYWSLRPEELKAPDGFPPEVFKAKGPSRLAWVAMCGHDADTYAAVAGPLIAAAYSELPTGFTEGLKALDIFDRLVKD